MILYQHRIYRTDLRNNREAYYLFGDNVKRVGYGGQAKEMRDEPNAIGVATKSSPYEYFHDKDLIKNVSVMWDDLHPAYFAVIAGRTLIIPSDGLGTGLSKLPEMAPRTNKALLFMMDHLKPISLEAPYVAEEMFEELQDYILGKLHCSP